MITLKKINDPLHSKIAEYLWKGYLDILLQVEIDCDNDSRAIDEFVDSPDGDVSFYYNTRLRKYSGSYEDGRIRFADEAGLTHFLLAHKL